MDTDVRLRDTLLQSETGVAFLSQDKKVYQCFLLLINHITHTQKCSHVQPHSCRCQGHPSQVSSPVGNHMTHISIHPTLLSHCILSHTQEPPHTCLDISHPPSTPRCPVHHPMGFPPTTLGLQVTFTLADTASPGPMSVVSSRHLQKHNLRVAGTPRLQDTRLPGQPPWPSRWEATGWAELCLQPHRPC